MASLLLRRSGVAVGLIAERLNWRADIVVQVGVGQHCEEVKVLDKEWPGVEWIGFEPHPGIVKQKQEQYPGELRQVAIRDSVGVAVLWWRDKHKDGSSFYTPGQIGVDCEGVRVKTSTLAEQDLVRRLTDKRVLLWLDCEGSELPALRGAGGVLPLVQMINVEVTAKRPSNSWTDHKELHRFLVAAGFYRQWIHTQRSVMGQYDAIYVRYDLFKEEYCCCPYEAERYLHNRYPSS